LGAKFAVYYVPPAESALYQRGSQLLGYDARTGEFLPTDNPTRAALPEWDDAWVAQPQTYGFHVTTGYSLHYDPTLLPDIERELEGVIKCFSPMTEFILTPIEERITIWNDKIIVLRCDPNPAMLMLHTLITARVNPYGTGSNISDNYAKLDPTTLPPAYVERVKRYFTPYMLDGWVPHFTLMMPYSGIQQHALRAVLNTLFPPDPISVKSICLLVRADGETHYRLHREFEIGA